MEIESKAPKNLGGVTYTGGTKSEQVQEIRHIQLNGKYRLKLERAASTKGIIGYTIEVNSDNRIDALHDIDQMKQDIETLCPTPVTEAKTEGK